MPGRWGTSTRRNDIVGIFPGNASVIRLVSMLAIEANDESLVSRGYISRPMAALYEIPNPDATRHSRKTTTG